MMSTLIEYGVSIPGDISSVSQFTSEALTSICAQLLNLIDPSLWSEEMPIVDDSLPERYMIFCTDIALSVKNLGYMGDITYHKVSQSSQINYTIFQTFIRQRSKATTLGFKGTCFFVLLLACLLCVAFFLILCVCEIIFLKQIVSVCAAVSASLSR